MNSEMQLTFIQLVKIVHLTFQKCHHHPGPLNLNESDHLALAILNLESHFNDNHNLSSYRLGTSALIYINLYTSMVAMIMNLCFFF